MGTCKWQQTLNWTTLVMMSGSKLFHSDLKRVIKSSRKWLLQVIADKDGSTSKGIIECTTVTMATVFGLWEELEDPKKAHENSKQKGLSWPESLKLLDVKLKCQHCMTLQVGPKLKTLLTSHVFDIVIITFFFFWHVTATQMHNLLKIYSSQKL